MILKICLLVLGLIFALLMYILVVAASRADAQDEAMRRGLSLKYDYPCDFCDRKYDCEKYGYKHNIKDLYCDEFRPCEGAEESKEE